MDTDNYMFHTGTFKCRSAVFFAALYVLTFYNGFHGRVSPHRAGAVLGKALEHQ